MEKVRIYNVPMDDFMVGVVLTSPMEMAHKNGISAKARGNYLEAYGNIKESINNQ